MYINSQNKQLQLQPLQGIITQGEKMADSVTFALPAVYGSLSLSDLSWNIRAASEKDTLATAALSVSTANDKCLLTWEVSSDFTAVSGALSLMLVGTDAAGNTVIKFPGDSPIWVRDSETGAYSPPEDAIENALNGLQQAEQALQDAITTLKEIGISLDVRGWYDTLKTLQSAVPTPEIGWVYGVGDPTVLYVYNGVEWVSLPGVSSTPPLPLSIANGGTGGTSVAAALANLGAQPGFNLLVNSRFKYNGRNQTSYTGGALTVDGWNSASGSVTITLPDGVTVANAASISQLVQQDSTLFSKSATFSVEDSPGTVYSVSATMPESAQNTSSQIASQSTPWGSISIWNSNTGSAFSVVISAASAVILTAAKLEIGSVSTLAADLATAQDETIEQLRLDMYDLDPGRPAWILTQNENLLDNWYFVGGGSQQGGGQFPINQRGQTIYTGGVYGIDRWKSNRTTTTVTVESNGIQFSDSNTDQGGIRQSLETDFQNKTVTLSLLVSEVTGGVRVWARNDSNFADYGTNTITSPGLVTVTATIPSGYPGNFCFYIDGDIGTSSSVSATILAAKLELGTRSTLARLVDGEWVLNDPPPNFQYELLKCQRFATQVGIAQNVCIADGDNQIQISLINGSTMRISSPTGQILTNIYAHQTDVNSVIDLSGSEFTINRSGLVITIKDSNLISGKMYVINRSNKWENFVSIISEIFISADL